MAKHRLAGRPEKRVLARQDVSAKHRLRVVPRPGPAPSANAHERPQGRGASREILGVFAFIASLGVVCALWTYHRDDALASRAQNLIGPVGHRIASRLFGSFGLCAYLVPVALFYTSLALFVRGKAHNRGRQIAGLVVLAVSGAVLAHLLIQPAPGQAYPPGGAVGAAAGEGLRALLSTVGSVLVMLAVSGGALIVATDAAFARFCVAAGQLTARTGAAVWAWSIDQAVKQWAAFRERRARRAEERIEEEEAFAKALAAADEAEREAALALAEAPSTPADEAMVEEPADELAEEEAAAEEEEPRAEEPTPFDQRVTDPGFAMAEAEHDANEADAIVEEAARLARQAEERRARVEAEAQARVAALRAAKKVRNAPDDDPAWASPQGGEERPRPLPNIALPPDTAAPVAVGPLVEAPVPAPVEAIASTVAAAAVAVTGQLPVEAPAPAAEFTPAMAAPVSAADAALPVIIAPKEPPKPTRLQEKKDPFAIVGSNGYTLPSISLLDVGEHRERVLEKETFYATAEKLREKLASFGIAGAVKEIRPGPVVTLYEFEPAPGIKISKIASLADDLAMAMEALKVRIIAPIPGKGVVGIEVPNKERETVFLREIIEQDAFTRSPSKITLALGKNIEGMPYVTNLAKMPHVLIAGTTGSGKSVSVNAMIMSILYKATPEEVRMIMVDPKVTELSIYEGIPHLLLPVVTDPRKAALALRWAVEEMERRYQLLADAGVRNIADFNKWVEKQDAPPPPPPEKPVEKTTASGRKIRIIDVGEDETEEQALARAEGGEPTLGVPAPNLDDDEPAVEVLPEEPAEEPEPIEAKAEEKAKKLPYIVIVIDEVADLMMVAPREVETYVARLAQMARAAGIHLMVATQRPSTDVITGVIKANFPSRISFQLRSKPDSMTILGTIGAEALLGMGDMLILPPTSAHMERVHGAFVSDAEIQKVVQFLKAQGKPVYDESILRPRPEDSEEGGEGGEEHNDEMYDQCLAIVSEMRQVSVSMLQRKLRLGYNRAARIIERMEKEGVVGPANGSKPREVLVRPSGQMHNEINV